MNYLKNSKWILTEIVKSSVNINAEIRVSRDRQNYSTVIRRVIEFTKKISMLVSGRRGIFPYPF